MISEKAPLKVLKLVKSGVPKCCLGATFFTIYCLTTALFLDNSPYLDGISDALVGLAKSLTFRPTHLLEKFVSYVIMPDSFFSRLLKTEALQNFQ